ncbi:MAG: hypothetical protein KM296_09325 [Brockia lithotrophica]|nr:hypothetical protein [Brockia lithotrophica]
MEVKVGDRVIFSKYAGTEVKVKDKEYLILREADILAPNAFRELPVPPAHTLGRKRKWEGRAWSSSSCSSGLPLLRASTTTP